jgi:RNA polymerase sigma-70 factor (ECF subfamily)
MIAKAHLTMSAAVPCPVPVTARTTTNQQMAIEDAILVQRFNAGDETAFVEIMSRYRHRLLSVAFSLLHNHADAEEITQDTFIRAHRGLVKFRGDAALATWLHRITLNLSRNRYWYYFRRCRHMSRSLEGAFNENNQGSFAELVATNAAGPERVAAVSEFSELVAMCMARMKARPREILILRNTKNYSYGEIAQKLGISVGTVKSRIARAREGLRLLLAEACPEFRDAVGPEAWFDPVRPAPGGLAICSA